MLRLTRHSKREQGWWGQTVSRIFIETRGLVPKEQTTATGPPTVSYIPKPPTPLVPRNQGTAMDNTPPQPVQQGQHQVQNMPESTQPGSEEAGSGAEIRDCTTST